MKKRKKAVKGMTLIEMIITIAILAMLCVILAMVGQNIDASIIGVIRFQHFRVKNRSSNTMLYS